MPTRTLPPHPARLPQQHRAVLASTEAGTATRITTAFARYVDTLSPHIMVLADRYSAELAAEQRAQQAAAEDAGDADGSDGTSARVPSSWLTATNGGNVAALLGPVAQGGDGFASDAIEIISDGMSAASAQGTADAQEYLAAALGPVAEAADVPLARLVTQVRGTARDHLEQHAKQGSGNGTLEQLFGSLGQSLADELLKNLFTNLARGANPTHLSQSLDDALDAHGLSKALTINRTETLGAYRSAAIDNYQANSDVCDGWVWNAALGGCCEFCAAMAGTVHSLDEDMDSHPNCRCVPSPQTKSYEDLFSDLGLDASDLPTDDLAETRYHPPSGEEWLRQQDAATQDRVLGKAGGKLYRDGTLKLADFVGSDPETGKPVRRSLTSMGHDPRAVLKPVPEPEAVSPSAEETPATPEMPAAPLPAERAAWLPLPTSADLAPMNVGTSRVLDFAANTPGAATPPPSGQIDRMASEMVKERAAHDGAGFGLTPQQWTAGDLEEIQAAFAGGDVVRLALAPDALAALRAGKLVAGEQGAGYTGLGGFKAGELTKAFAPKDAELVTAILREDARGIAASDLRDLQRTLLKTVEGNLAEAEANLQAGDTSERERVARLTMLRDLYGDRGRLALLKGYDFIVDDAGNGRTSYQVVNPGAMRLAPKDIQVPDLTTEGMAKRQQLQREARIHLATQAEDLERRFGWKSLDSTPAIADALAARLAKITVPASETRLAAAGGSLPTRVEFNPDVAPELANEIAAAYGRMADLFPQAAGNIRWLGTTTTEGGQNPARIQPAGESILAHVSSPVRDALPPAGEVGLFDVFWNDMAALRESPVEYLAGVALQPEVGHFVQGETSAVGTMIHEFGHIVHFHLLFGSSDPALRTLGQDWIAYYQQPGKLQEVESLSRYGASNPMEVFAEAFCALYNGTTTQWNHSAVQRLRQLLRDAYGPEVLPHDDGSLP